VYPVENKIAVRRVLLLPVLLHRLLTLASVIAISNSLLVAWNMRALGRFLTADVAVLQAMGEHAVYWGAAIFCIPYICS
jgi:hypothetical protein